MPGYLGNFPITYRYLLFECGIFLRFWKFLKRLEISKIPRHLEISQIPRHLRNFQNIQSFEKLPKSFKFTILRYLQEFGEFPKSLGIWEISQMSRFSGNSPNIQSLGEISKILKIYNPANYRNLAEFPKCLGIWEISQMPRFISQVQRNWPNLLQGPMLNNDNYL